MMMKFTWSLLVVFEISFITFNALAQKDTGLFKAELIENELIVNNAPFKQCHASSLVELSDGKIMVVWFGGTYERHPDVCIWGSIKQIDGWSKPTILADGIIIDTLRFPCWNPVLFKSKNGELFLFYKIGPSPGEWWGLYKKSQDDGQTWSEPVELPEGILGPVKNKPIYLSGGRIISPGSVEKGNTWKACMELSDDDGITWSKVFLDTTAGYKLIQPTLLKLRDGSILALMRSNQNCIIQSRSKDDGTTWSKPMKTSIMNPNSGIDAVTLTNGLHLLVNNPTVSGKEWFGGRNKLFVMASADGENWYDIYKLEDKISGEYSYPAIIQTHDEMVHIVYTNDRTIIKHVVLRIIE